jgi:hypothetical protein
MQGLYFRHTIFNSFFNFIVVQSFNLLPFLSKEVYKMLITYLAVGAECVVSDYLVSHLEIWKVTDFYSEF